MKRAYLFFLFYFFIGLSCFGLGQFNFKKYQVENGLSHNTVWCILQDSYGFMWFGSSDGLNRFDGKSFVVYRQDDNDNSLGDNSVQTIFEDDNRNLWIGTSKGIYIYERNTDSFKFFDKKTAYGVPISSEVKKIIKTETGKIFIGTLGQGIFIYDSTNETLSQNSLYSSFVWDICEDNAHRIYVTSLQDGLICFDQNGRFIESFKLPTTTEESVFSRISCIQNINNFVYFSVGLNSIGQLNPKTKEIRHFVPQNLNLGTIRCMSQYSDREIFVGADNGFYLFNIVDEQFHRIDNPLDPRSLSDQTVNAIFKDLEGGFWISTYLGGINYLGPQSKTFEYYYPVYTGLNTSKVINQFCESRDNTVWIGTQEGLRIFNPADQTIRTFNLPEAKQKIDVRSLLLDGDNLWIGTLGNGLKVLNIKTNKMKTYYHENDNINSIGSNEVLSLFKDSKGVVFVGTSWGLCRYDSVNDYFIPLIFVGSMASVLDMHEDKQGFLWVATYNMGVFRVDINNHDNFHNYSRSASASNGILSNSVISIFESNDGVLWFGTNGNGLCYLDREADRFINFDPENKILPNKVIYSIEEDNLGYFWISTNAGLLQIKPTDQNSRKLYTKEDGLQSNQFNFSASLRSKDGRLYFGGINGFNVFYPEEFKENTYVPKVYIVGLQVGNTQSGQKETLGDLKTPIYLTESLQLSHHQNNISFEFSSLSYERPKRNKYSYILEGYDVAWKVSDNVDVASYTNLPPGKYTFKVRGSNNDNVWSEKSAVIELVISPPWWRSNVAYLLYFALVLFLLYLAFHYFTLNADKKLKLQMEDFQVNKDKEIYQSKIKFFINLVHEIRTPLSLINLPLERLTDMKINNPDAPRYLGIITNNVNYLLNVVNQLLSFQKIENKSAELNVEEQNLNELLKSIYNQFSGFTELKKLKLELNLPKVEDRAQIDKDFLTKIVLNLLGNAIRYATTEITLSLEVGEDNFDIIVADDGPGIADDEKVKIFDIFYQSDDNQLGTGIGLAFSKSLTETHGGTLKVEDSKSGGALFRLSMPLVKAAMAERVQLVEVQSDIEDESKTSSQTAENYHTSKVLLVEDNKDLLAMIDESLSPYFTILKAENGKVALSILEEETIDIIISDVMMPVMDGFEFTRIVKSDLNYSHIPIILLTAKVTNEAQLEGMEYGADVYLGKPFSAKILRKQVENLLKLKFSIQKMISNISISAAPVEFNISKKDNEFLEKLYAEIDKHLNEFEFSIDNLAETMYMSRSNFYRKIKGISGMSPNDFLKTIRLNKAAELLRQDDSRIKEVYEQVGFNSSSYFAKCFKTQFGVLPKDYVK